MQFLPLEFETVISKAPVREQVSHRSSSAARCQMHVQHWVRACPAAVVAVLDSVAANLQVLQMRGADRQLPLGVTHAKVVGEQGRGCRGRGT